MPTPNQTPETPVVTYTKNAQGFTVPVNPQSPTDNQGNPVSLPRVTPPANTGNTPPVTYAAGNVPIGGTISDPKPGQPGYVAPLPVDKPKTSADMRQEFQANEDANYQKLLGRSSALINDVNASYKDKLNSANAASAARVNAGGLSGSTAGGQIYTEAQQPIINERNTALDTIYKNIQDTATDLTLKETELADKEAQNSFNNSQTLLENNRQAKADALASATKSIAALAANHLDWNTYKTQNPENYNALVSALGGDPNVADAMFAMSVPANVIDSSFTTSDGQGGTVITQVSHDPLTNKPSIQKYTMPGISIPQNWTSDKFGTNATIFKSPTFNANDPSTYVIVSTDPTNNGAITVTKDGKTTVNGIDINELPGITPSTGTVGAAGGIASMIGLADPTMPLSAVLSDPMIGIEGIVSAIIKNEGGSPKGVLNNGGNIKFAGLPGQKDSGIKATDGGTFASYDTPQAGKQAIADLVNKGASAGKNFDDFINGYTGTGQGSASGSILSATGISLPVFNYLTQGTPSMSRMNASDRKKIMAQATEYLNKMGVDVSTFQSQYKAYNDVLASNISRNAKTKIMENELNGTIQNLTSVAQDKDLGNVNVGNVLTILAGGQVNDPIAARYAFHYGQLQNELAGYFAASQGKASPDVIDNQDAAHAITSGLSTGALSGLRTAVEDSTNKMSGILQKSIDNAQKDVWSLFGVGDKFKGKADDVSSQNVSSAPVNASGTLSNGTKVLKASNGNWYDEKGNAYDSNGNPL